jgi:erythromycin esterase-like protein
MSYRTYATLAQWAAQEAIPFSLDALEDFDAAVDQMIALVGDSVELLGFGEALHGGKDFLLLRNRLFQRLVEAHGYSATAVESSFPRAHGVNEYIAGHGAASYDTIKDAGFSHGFGQLDDNRELIEWLRRFNADSSHRVMLQFYGFDSPTEMVGADSPRQVLNFALAYSPR